MNNAIIFLDMDGVMVSPRAAIIHGSKGVYSYIDPVAVEAVNHLAGKGKAKIVISSTWRNMFDAYSMQQILLAAGVKNQFMYFDKNDVGDRNIPEGSSRGPSYGFFTPSIVKGQRFTEHVIRGRQIKQWLDDHPHIRNYLILDDDSDMLPDQMNHFVKTDVYNGITLQNFLDAQRILHIKDIASVI